MADSPLAQIKVQELLKEVRVDYTRCRIVDSAVAAVKERLLSLPEKKVSSHSYGFFTEMELSKEFRCLSFFVRLVLIFEL